METGWLIEQVANPDDASGSCPTWLCVVAGQFNWTPESTLAIRFSRKQDAQHLMEHYGVVARNKVVVTEHVWGLWGE